MGFFLAGKKMPYECDTTAVVSSTEVVVRNRHSVRPQAPSEKTQRLSSAAVTLRERRRQHRLRLVLFPLLAVLVALTYSDVSNASTKVASGFSAKDLVDASLTAAFLLALVLVALATRSRSPHVIFRPADISVSLVDVVGVPGAVAEATRTLRLFTDRQVFAEELGGSVPWGVIFEGAPGMGKVLVAKAMAKEAGVPALVVDAPALIGPTSRQTRRRIRAYFRDLAHVSRTEGGGIGVIEGIDRLTPARGLTSEGNMHLWAEGELLLQIQSMEQPTLRSRAAISLIRWLESFLTAESRTGSAHRRRSNVFLVATTANRQLVDSALFDSGMLDRTVTFNAPSLVSRADLVRFHLNRKAHDPTLDVPEAAPAIATMTSGYSLAETERLMDEALVMALTDGRSMMSLTDITRAKLGLEFGQSETTTVDADERRRLALHESAHALVAYELGGGQTLEVLSIIKRKESLGLLHHGVAEESTTQKRSQMEVLLRVLMAGLAAEEYAFDDPSSGPASDLAIATQIGAAMVGSFGMGRALISIMPMVEEELNDGLLTQVLSDPELREELEALLARAYQEATDIVTNRWAVIEHLAAELLIKEEMIGRQITDAIEAVMPPQPLAILSPRRKNGLPS